MERKTGKEDISALAEKVVEMLERLLMENCKVLVVYSIENDLQEFFHNAVRLICEAKKEKICFLTDIMALQELSERIYFVSTEEMQWILKLYRTYEFSGRLQIMQQTTEYCGNLTNYIKNGLLTEEEYFQLMLEV